jgi:hypothetical protein
VRHNSESGVKRFHKDNGKARVFLSVGADNADEGGTTVESPVTKLSDSRASVAF